MYKKENLNINQRNFEGKILSRGRLTELIRNNLDKNLILIYSPAGYGKTTLALDFIYNCRAKTSWLTITEEIDHVYTFFNYLIHSLKRLKNEFGNNTLKLIESRQERSQSSKNIRSLSTELVKTFVNEFNKCFKETVIAVIDDFQNVKDSKLTVSTFNYLFNHFPPNLRLMVVTRQIPDFNFIPLLAEGKMVKIGIEELSFNSEEIAELLEKVYRVNYTEDNLIMLEKNLGGWITGIQMVLQSNGRSIEFLKIEPQKIPENIFNYLAEQIFSGFDNDTQNFMLCTAMFDKFEKNVCNYFKDIKIGSQIIHKLVDKNILQQNWGPLSASELGDKIYFFQYQKLFRQFLISRLYKNYPNEKIKTLRKTVLKYYFGQNDFTSAINYLLKTKDYKKAIPLIKQNFERMFEECKYEILWKWLLLIEESNIEDPYIIFYFGILYKFFAADLETSLKYIERAISILRQKNDKRFLVKCYVNKASIMVNLGKTEEVISEMTDLLDEFGTDENRAKLLYYLAYAYYQNAQYDISGNLLIQSLIIADKNKELDVSINIHILLGHINLIKGEYKRSTLHYEKIANLNPNIIDTVEILCNLVLLHSQSGNYREAKSNLDKLDETVDNYPSPIFKIPYLLAKQAYYFEIGEYEKNLSVLNEINSIAVSMNHVNYLYLSSRLLADTYYHMDDLENANKCLKSANTYLNKKNELELVEIANVKALLEKKTSACKAQTESTLLFARDYYTKEKLIYSRVQADFHLADYYYKTGKHRLALNYLKECLVTSREKNYISHLYREMKHSTKLFRFALSNKIEEEFINRLLVNCNKL